MRSGLKVGVTGVRRFVVEPAHTIDFAEGGMPAILCTPWLVWFLEHAARDAVVPFLDEGESTVGSHVDVDHLAATPGRPRRDLCRAGRPHGGTPHLVPARGPRRGGIDRTRVPPPAGHRGAAAGPKGRGENAPPGMSRAHQGVGFESSSRKRLSLL